MSINRLLSIASPAVGDDGPILPTRLGLGPLGQELQGLLSARNGFYAYDSALLVRPLQNAFPLLGIIEWNEPKLWKSKYDNRQVLDVTCFAEDVFGCQYCLGGGCVSVFEPETGEFTKISATLSEWAEEIVSNHNFRTGASLANEWCVSHGELKRGMRLLPKVPFVCGGKYELDNLYQISDIRGMSFRASLANQIAELPDGAEITFRVPPEQ